MYHNVAKLKKLANASPGFTRQKVTNAIVQAMDFTCDAALCAPSTKNERLMVSKRKALDDAPPRKRRKVSDKPRKRAKEPSRKRRKEAK